MTDLTPLTMSDVTTFVMIAQTSVLIIVSLLIVYPVVAYSRNVAHTRGLLLLAGSFMVLTFTYVASYFFHMDTTSAVLDLTAAILAALGSWQFARPFVRFGGGEVGPTEPTNATGGFESAGDD